MVQRRSHDPRPRRGVVRGDAIQEGIGEAHFVAVPSSTKVPPSTVTADVLVDASLHGDVFKNSVAQNGSFPVRASERSAHVIGDLISGQAYDVFFVIEAANSNGLFSAVGQVLGVATNGLAPAISSLTAAPVDGRTNASQLSFSMDAPGVPCRVWYTVLPLQDVVLLEVEPFSAEEIKQAAQPGNVVDLPQGLKGVHSPLPIVDSLESNTWYQVSAISERAVGVFSEPMHTVMKTHREPARIIENKVTPVQGSTDSLAVEVRLDCSSAPTNEACGLLSYRVTETLPGRSPAHTKPRQVAQGTAEVLDGRLASHIVAGMGPGKVYSVSMAIETPGSNGALGPALEVAATTFPHAPKLIATEAARSEVEASTVVVRFKLSEPGLVHISLTERIDHPLALVRTIVGNQHGFSFSREVGTNTGSSDDGSGPNSTLEGSQEIHHLAAGSTFDVTAQTESTLHGRQSSVYGEAQTTTIEAVPPVIARVRASAPDATTTELLLEYEVMETAGMLHYALSDAVAAVQGGKRSLSQSAETVKAAVEGQAGVVVAGSTYVSPRGSHAHGINASTGDSNGPALDKPPPLEQLRFRGVEPSKRYTVSLCTESISGILSEVTVAEVEAHAEAPLIAGVTATPANRSADALSLTVALESSGLVHVAVRRAAEMQEKVVNRDHTIVYKATREVIGTRSSSSQPRPPSPPSNSVAAGVGVLTTGGTVSETVEGLEPNATYEIHIATETTNSNGVYRANPETILVTTHSVPSRLLNAGARAADASSSALIVTASLESLAELHYAVLQVQKTRTPGEDNGVARGGIKTTSGDRATSGVEAREEELRGGLHGVAERARDWGCGGPGEMNGGGMGPVVFNKTTDLASSGVVPSTTIAGFLATAVDEKNTAAQPASAAPAVGMVAKATTLHGDGQSTLLAASRSSESDALEVVFRVEGLQAAQAYSICLFTETPASNGLFGGVYELQPVSTHTPVPELASERVACNLDCRELNRDPCWLEANKCGECLDGFSGKAGHVNSLCGKVPSLTEDDIARINERERRNSRDIQKDLKDNENADSGNESMNAIAQDGSLLQPGSLREAVTTGATSSGSADPPDDSRSSSRLLMGVPVAAGPNVTKYLYADLPEESGRGPGNGTEPAGNQLGAEEEAARLCGDLHSIDGDKEAFSSCLSSLTAAIRSRYRDGRFHREDDPERPILQVEVDAPGGKSLAFTLRHGEEEEEGLAVVRFCREHEEYLPDEQACVVMLMQEIAS